MPKPSPGQTPYLRTSRASAAKREWALGAQNAATSASNVGPGPFGASPSLTTVGTGVKRTNHTAFREVNDSRGMRHIRGKDFMDTVSVTTSTAEGTLIYQFLCNPRSVDASLLRGESGFYENWEGSWTVHISMTSGSGVSGSLGAYFEVDATDKRPRTIHDIRQQCFTHGGHVTTLWEESEWRLLGAPNKMYYVDIGVEPRESVQGIWNLFLDTTASANTKFDLWISYDIRLYNSKFDEDSIVPGSSGYFPNTISTGTIFSVADFDPNVPGTQWDEGQVEVKWLSTQQAGVNWAVSNWWCISWVMRVATSMTNVGAVLPNTWGTCPFNFFACDDDGNNAVSLVSGSGIYGGAALGDTTAFQGGWAVLYRPPALAVKTQLKIAWACTVVGAATANNNWILWQPMCAQDTTLAKQVGNIYPFSQDSVRGALSGIKVQKSDVEWAPLPQAGDEDPDTDTTDTEASGSELDEKDQDLLGRRRRRRRRVHINTPAEEALEFMRRPYNDSPREAKLRRRALRRLQALKLTRHQENIMLTIPDEKSTEQDRRESSLTNLESPVVIDKPEQKQFEPPPAPASAEQTKQAMTFLSGLASLIGQPQQQQPAALAPKPAKA
jgi:hypothetical protein